MSTPKAGSAVVVSEGEAGRLPFDLRNILAPTIIAWRQTLGFSSAGIEEVGAGFAGFTFGAAEAMAPAYVALTGGGLATGWLAVGLVVVVWNCERWVVIPPDLAIFLLGDPSTSALSLEAASVVAA